MPAAKQRTRAEIEQRQAASLKHGAGAGEVALSKGNEFTGLAKAAEQAVSDELEVKGLAAIVKRDAIRLQAVADLYFGAILGADNLDRLDALVKRWGWIQASSLRAWLSLRDIEGQEQAPDIDTILKSYKDQGNEHDS